MLASCGIEVWKIDSRGHQLGTVYNPLCRLQQIRMIMAIPAETPSSVIGVNERNSAALMLKLPACHCLAQTRIGTSPFGTLPHPVPHYRLCRFDSTLYRTRW